MDDSAVGAGGSPCGGALGSCVGEGGSASSSDSESSPSDRAPTVEGLLNGESGLSGPSSSSSASGAGAALAAGSCRLAYLGKTLTGDGRRS